MDKKQALKMKQMTIEEKIALLSETEEAYIRGFIEGAIQWSYQSAKQNGDGKTGVKPKSAEAAQKTRKSL
jgi:hypothetical protein